MRHACSGLAALLGLLLGCSSVGSRCDPLEIAQTILLPSVEGGFDLMAVDLVGRRLFVAAEDNNTVEVLDLDRGEGVRSVGGIQEPKWVVYRPETHKLYVASGGTGAVKVIDSRTFEELLSIPFKEKANNLRFDPRTALLYVGVGKTFGAIGVIDTQTDQISGTLALAAFPKQFELERAGNRIFVNVPSERHVAVLDRSSGRTIATWAVKEAMGNIPMALDETSRRLYIGCESVVLVVLDTETGRPVASVVIDQGPDGVYVDSRRRLIYISCASGYLDVIRPQGSDRYERISRIATAPGAATSLWVPELDGLFLAVPKRGTEPAAIRLYRPSP